MNSGGAGDGTLDELSEESFSKYKYKYNMFCLKLFTMEIPV